MIESTKLPEILAHPVRVVPTSYTVLALAVLAVYLIYRVSPQVIVSASRSRKNDIDETTT